MAVSEGLPADICVLLPDSEESCGAWIHTIRVFTYCLEDLL